MVINSKNQIKKAEQISNNLKYFAEAHNDDSIKKLNSSNNGLSNIKVEESKEKYGINETISLHQDSLLKRIIGVFIDPFTLVLILLTIVSIITDIVIPKSGNKEYATVIIISLMILISGTIKFVQETKSGNAAEKLTEMIETTTCIERVETGKQEIPLDEVVVGDIVYLASGDIIPADVKILSAKDLFISQSALTGESEPVEKLVEEQEDELGLLEYTNIAYMGTSVVSGSGKALVIAVGNNTVFGNIAIELTNDKEETSFEKGMNSVSLILIRLMLVVVPIVFLINGFLKGDWLNAFIFAISIAVGLTPEMLPMIVTTCLAKGAVTLSKQKVITKKINSVQNLGAMNVLCTDKTGTLTRDKIILEFHLDISGNESSRVLKHGFLNSYYQTGLKNLMDISIIERTRVESKENPSLRDLDKNYTKVDEIPFDFERRRMSVVVIDKNRKTQLITKGAIEEMISISSYVDYEGEILPMNEETKKIILEKVDSLNERGMRVLGVSQKTNPSGVDEFSVKDENDMVLIGYLAFLDPPKDTAKPAIEALNKFGVDVKVLTGDNEKVTETICKQVGLKVDKMLLGNEVENMTDEELFDSVDDTTVFAKLSPDQKSRVVRILQKKDKTIGYMGDGINDTLAMKKSDVGISVDTAVDIAKESADIILLEKDLMVLEEGIIEGRKVYGNMIKYIKMTVSSNFGNIFSILIASSFLPFLPMQPIHLLLLNLIYDISCIAIPWDNVDEEFIKRPKSWNTKSITRFMAWIGPISSIFDILTYIILYFIICPAVAGGEYTSLTTESSKLLFMMTFQAGWFIESMWSQTLIIHIIRTDKIPFIQSRASKSLTFLSLFGIALVTIIPFTQVGIALGFSKLPSVFFLWLALIMVLYILLVLIVKKIYIKKYNEFI